MKVLSLVKKENTFTLYPLSDVHWPEHDEEKLDQWIEAVEADDKALVTLGGDMFDFARGKYRAHVAAYTGDNNSRRAIDDMAYERVEALATYLARIKKKIIAICVGNHFWTFANGRTSDQELAVQMGIADKFVGSLGLLRVTLRGVPIRLAMHHDAGRKGGTASADLLAFQHWSHAVASDIYIAGHTHRQYAGIFHTRISITDEEPDKVGDKKLVFVRSGAFLRGYAESIIDPEAPFIPDYAEVAMLPPSALGIISVKTEVSAKGKIYYELRQRTL